jgi:hypothetical protein
MSNTLFEVFKINESIKTCMREKKYNNSDCITNSKGFLVTGYVNGCPIHYFKSLKSMNLLRHA